MFHSAGNPTTPYSRGKTAWYVYDGLGSVVGETDFNGLLTTTAKYDVYGAKRAGGTGTATSRQGFVGSLGHMTDTETGLVYMRARYYDPNVGRFESEDPIGKGNNWFIYCDNNPVNEVDKVGKQGEVTNSSNNSATDLYSGFGILAAFTAITVVWSTSRYKTTDDFSLIFATTMALTAVYLLGMATGKTSAEAAEDAGGSLAVELVASVIAGEKYGGQVANAGAGAIASVALIDSGIYSLRLIGAM